MPDKTDLAWYKEELGSRMQPGMRDVFRRWSKMEDDEKLLKHLHDVRDRAWPLGYYPCVGQWMFLLPSISAFPEYKPTLRALLAKTTEAGGGRGHAPTVLDLGCCFGQDLRLLANDGLDTRAMWASDLNGDLWKLGYELFKDSGSMHAHFIQGDFVADANVLLEDKTRKDVDDDDAYNLQAKPGRPSDFEGYLSSLKFDRQYDFGAAVAATAGGSADSDANVCPPLPLGAMEPLRARADLIVAAQFLHLFDLRVQTFACAKMAAMTRVGGCVWGYQQSRRPARLERNFWGSMYFHDAASWRAMWRAVEKLTGTRWTLAVREQPLGDWGSLPEDLAFVSADAQGIQFVCTRTA